MYRRVAKEVVNEIYRAIPFIMSKAFITSQACYMNGFFYRASGEQIRLTPKWNSFKVRITQ